MIGRYVNLTRHRQLGCRLRQWPLALRFPCTGDAQLVQVPSSSPQPILCGEGLVHRLLRYPA